MKYRIKKDEYIIGDTENHGFPFVAYDGSDVVIVRHYLVQVRNFVLWHTVKKFTKILPAARLLHQLKKPQQ